MQVRNRKPDNEAEPPPKIPCGVCGAWTLRAGKRTGKRITESEKGVVAVHFVLESWVGCVTCGMGRRAKA